MSSSSGSAPTWALRLRFRVTTRINSEDDVLPFEFAGRPCELEALDGALKNSYWLAIRSTGFISEVEARRFGERLRSALVRYAVRTSWGVDAGEDLTTSGTSQSIKDHVQAVGGRPLRDNVHGLDVFVDEDPVFFEFRASGTVIRAAAGVAEGLSSEATVTGELSSALAHANSLFAVSMVMTDQIARLVLAVAAVEVLAQGARWSKPQIKVLKRLANEGAKDPSLTPEEAAAVKSGIDRAYNQGVLVGMRALFARLDLSDLLEKWMPLYSERSALVHGLDAVSMSRMPQLAHEVSDIAKAVLAAQLRLETIRSPS